MWFFFRRRGLQTTVVLWFSVDYSRRRGISFPIKILHSFLQLSCYIFLSLQVLKLHSSKSFVLLYSPVSAFLRDWICSDVNFEICVWSGESAISTLHLAKEHLVQKSHITISKPFPLVPLFCIFPQYLVFIFPCADTSSSSQQRMPLVSTSQ